MVDYGDSRVPLLAASSSRVQSASDLSLEASTIDPGYGSISTVPSTSASRSSNCQYPGDLKDFNPRKDPITQQAHDEVADDLQITIKGLQDNPTAILCYQIAGVLSLGIIFLLRRWLPGIHRRWTTQLSSLEGARKVLIRNQFGEEEQVLVDTLQFDGRYSQLFPTECNLKVWARWLQLLIFRPTPHAMIPFFLQSKFFTTASSFSYLIQPLGRFSH